MLAHTHSKPDLAVTALLQTLNEELDRRKGQQMEDLKLAKMQSSVHGRLGPRINEQDVQVSHWRGGSELCGVIFMCNRRTWRECLGQCLFGLPTGKKSLVEQVIPGMKLFLFEYERRQLWGVFEAASYGGIDIIPNAYSGGSFPCQVLVKVPEECIALYEEEFCEAIRDNYFSHDKFQFDLSEKQVCHLTSLFERKYFSSSMMHSNLLKYEDKRCIAEGCKPNGGLPLLLTNDATCLYPEDLLQHSWYSSSCEVTNGPFLFNSKEGMDPLYKSGESRMGRKSSETGSLVPLPNGALEIVQSDVASLTGELGKGFDIVNASCLTCYESNNHSIVEDFATGDDAMLFPDNVSRLHSDRPIAKSVWARISGRSKSLVALESTEVKKSPAVNPVLKSAPKVCTISEMDVADDSLVQDLYRADVSEEVAEKFSVGFKRRRSSNNNASVKVDETPNKRRRKLTRPSFEASAEQGKFVDEKIHLPSANGALDFSKSTSMEDQYSFEARDLSGNVSVLAELPTGLEDSLPCDMCKLTALDPRERIVMMNTPSCGQGNGIVQAGHDVCQPNILDLNLPVEASIQNEQGVVIVGDNSRALEDENQCTTVVTAEAPTKLEQHIESFNETGPNTLVCEMQQEPCSLALSLATQETVLLQSRQGIDDSNPAESTGRLPNQPQALSCSEEQGSDLQQAHISSKSTSLDFVGAESSRASTCSLAPCTPAKDFLDSSYSVSEQCDDRKGFSPDLVQDIPLTLELGKGAQLPDVKLDESSNGNLSKESNIISLDCTSGGNMLNQVDLKSFLSGLQVSGIKLQLGASPCLILQLGDLAGSTSNVDSQDQGGATPGQPESR